MKFTKIIPALFVCAAMLVGSSCNEKTEYVPAESAPLEPYYFTTLNDTYRELVDGQTEFEVYMGRADRISAKEVSFEVVTDAPEGAFTYPTSVNFAEGQNAVSFVVKFDLTKLETNKEYKLDFKLAGIQNTPYCYGNMEVTTIYIPWRKFDKKGIYRDGTITGVYSSLASAFPEGIQYEVEIEEHPTTDGLYRIVNPYGPGTPLTEAFDTDGETHYMLIHAENPNQVYVEPFATGLIDPNDGMIYMESASVMLEGQGKTPEQLAKDGYYASNVNGIIKYRDAANETVLKQTLICWFENDEGPYIGNAAGNFKVVLPGYEDEPDVPEWEDLGMFNYTDGFRTPFAGVAEPNTYPVLVQQNVPDPNIFRIVNPYGVASGFVTVEPEENTYMVFDTTNPDCVLMEDYESGLKKGLGFVYFTTWADYYIQEEGATIDEMEGFGGIYNDKKIVIPAANCAYKVITAAGKFLKAYDCGGTTDACLDMSTPVGEPEAEAAMAKIRANELNMSSVAKKYLKPVKF